MLAVVLCTDGGAWQGFKSLYSFVSFPSYIQYEKPGSVYRQCRSGPMMNRKGAAEGLVHHTDGKENGAL
jgi:hypothetical protein